MSMDAVKGRDSKFSEKMERVSIVDKLTAHVGGAVGSAMAFAGGFERVAETAKLIGDASKSAVGVSSLFQLVALGRTMGVDVRDSETRADVATNRTWANWDSAGVRVA